MISKKNFPKSTSNKEKALPLQKKFNWSQFLAWGATALIVSILLFVSLIKPVLSEKQTSGYSTPISTPLLAMRLPTMKENPPAKFINVSFSPNLYTNIPPEKRYSVVKYTVQIGDSIFSIAKQFGLKPESVLWANYDYFKDVATSMISIGWVLNIPPTDGILYTWKDGDDLVSIAAQYNASESDILCWPSNHLDINNPTISAGALVMIPGGSRPLQSWIQVVPYAPKSGVTRVVAGPGSCQVPDGGPIGSTAFIWPSANHYLSGFDFVSWHLGIDIAANTGDPVWAADNGTVVYAGWNDSGYGNMVIIDHNNGYATAYGHLSAIYVTCGSSIYQGQALGAAGSTGNSTGSHLHFEIRQNGGFINPWYLLP
ncbi:MAG: LysM peptidoglycan-binding domain-containing M23 family metallopeptidase [Anaerolineaceae bacterium]|nr:LysM peptidoglycan-binding domain-containing M23 family metallopeptidase [Anaerolineaceae bacterium]